MTKSRSGNKPAGEALPDAKLTIKVGDSEIQLEARPDIVRQELDRLVERLLPPAATGVGADPVVVSVTAPAARGASGQGEKAEAPVAVKDGGEPAQGEEAPEPLAVKEGGAPPAPLDFIVQTRGRQMIKPGVDKLLEHVTLDPERLAELYAVDARGRVLLKKLPGATKHQLRNTVLLLLFGGLTMSGETSESGYRLVQAVRGMGLRIERIPREFGPGSELAVSFGRHRSKRYRLTAGGIRYCEQLIPGLLRALRH